MEDELLAQRDAAIAVSKELQRQLQQQRNVVEKTIERRAFRAERLRLRAEENLRRVTDDRNWEQSMNVRQLYLSLFSGMIGAILGWTCGLLVFIVFSQPTIGFLLVLPGMASGSVVGLALAKTKVQFETHRRQARRRKSRHQFDGSNDDEFEAMLFDLDQEECEDQESPSMMSGPLPPLSSSSATGSNSLTFRSNSSQDFQQQPHSTHTGSGDDRFGGFSSCSSGAGGSGSGSGSGGASMASTRSTPPWKTTGNLMYQTAVTCRDLALAVYDSNSFVSGLLYGTSNDPSSSSIHSTNSVHNTSSAKACCSGPLSCDEKSKMS